LVTAYHYDPKIGFCDQDWQGLEGLQQVVQGLIQESLDDRWTKSQFLASKWFA